MKKELSEDEKTAACLLFLFALLSHDVDDEESWYMYCTLTRKHDDSFEACVWWAIRMCQHDKHKDAEDFLGYLKYVCQNKRYLKR